MCREAITGAVLVAALFTSSCGSNCLEIGSAGSLCGEREATMPILSDGQGMPVVAGTLDGAPIRLLLDSGGEPHDSFGHAARRERRGVSRRGIAVY